MAAIKKLIVILQDSLSFPKSVYVRYGPPEESRTHIGGRRPHNGSVVWSLMGLVVLVGTVAIAAAIASPWTFFTVGAIGLSLTLGLIGGAGYDMWVQPPRHRSYNRNLGNTILTAITATALMTALYMWQWYPSLNQIVLQLSDDTVPEVPYPGIALFEKAKWSTQAHLVAGHSKCYLGWYNESAPMCTKINSSSITPSSSCNCKDIWSPTVTENFTFQDGVYRYLEFPTASKLNCTTPTTLLWLQAFFNYNTSKAKTDNGYTPSPGLSLAIYDPRLTLTFALHNSYTRMVDINAAGVTSINLRLRLRRDIRGRDVYDYDLSISSRPVRDLVCDTGHNRSAYYGDCATSLFIRIPSFDRTIVAEQRAMSWVAVANSAGAYYSLFNSLAGSCRVLRLGSDRGNVEGFLRRICTSG